MWNYLNVSVKGASHETKNIPCQDNNWCSIIEDINGSKILVSVVSDGAGSALKAEIGSAETCNKFSAHLINCLENGTPLSDFTKDFFKNWITEFQNELAEKATSEESTIRDYASTFLASIISDSVSYFIQIGDGAIIIKGEDGEYSYMFAPQQGQYANQTFFITDEKATERMQFERIEKPIEQIAIFSDGIQNLILDIQNHTVNQDFFSEWFNWLSQVEDQNMGNTLLAEYLNSEKINERTDDDKTLILAIKTDEKMNNISSLND
jgi:Protein phosphatase 2C